MNKFFDYVRLLDQSSEVPEGFNVICQSYVFPSLVYVSRQEVSIKNIELAERELIAEYKHNLAYILFRFLIVTGVYREEESDSTIVPIDLGNITAVNSSLICDETVTVAEYNSVIKLLQTLAPSQKRSETLAVLMKTMSEDLVKFEPTSAVPTVLWDAMLLYFQIIRNIDPSGTIELATSTFRPFLKTE